MEFTTLLVLHSQGTRLWGEPPPGSGRGPTGLAPSAGDGPVQGRLGLAAPRPGRVGPPTHDISLRVTARDSVLGSSLFARRYWGNPC